MINRDSKTPVYKQIYEDISLRILQGEYPFGSMLPSESKLCSIYGVERATVRRALALMVDDGKVVRVPGLGTSVVNPERQVEQGKKKTLLLLLPKGLNDADLIREPFNAQLMDAMERECYYQGYDLLYKSYTQDDTVGDIVRTCNPIGVFLASYLSMEMYSGLQKLGIPAVLVNLSHPAYPSVGLDNKGGASLVMDHLLAKGHREIGYIGATMASQIHEDRIGAYMESLTRSGLSVNPDWVVLGDWTMASGRAAMRTLIKRGNLPTAIFAANDAMAIGAIMEASDAGIGVPEDISIVGFDNVDQAVYIRPTLTTVALDHSTLARSACMLMSDMINRGNSELNVTIYVPLRLVERESTRSISPV